ncbi:MAG: restriction endonuclease [Candidatus Binatia bacterium]
MRTAAAVRKHLQTDWDVTSVPDANHISSTDGTTTPYDVVLENLPFSYPHLFAPDGYSIALTPNDPLFDPGSVLSGATRIVTGGEYPDRAAKAAGVFSADYIPRPLDPALLAERLASRRAADLLYTDNLNDAALELVRLPILAVNDGLLLFLAKHPNVLRDLDWRRFEEVVAALLEKSGFTVHLQRGTKDGGVDIIAANHVDVDNIVMLVQCKQVRRYVGVEVVRQLHGVVQQRRATMGLVATTSYFTRSAIEFREPVAATLMLRDFNEISAWLKRSR